MHPADAARTSDATVPEDGAARAAWRGVLPGSGPDLHAVADAEGRLVAASGGWQRLLGCDPATLAGEPLWSLAHPDDRDALAGALACLSDLGAEQEVSGEHRLVAADGTTRWFLWTAWPIGRCLRQFRAVDISERKRTEEHLTHRASHDALTGLPSRGVLVEHLAHRLAVAGSRVAVLFVDIDRFKSVNDVFGHQTGDALLVEVSSRLQRAVRQPDLVARFGGDEFVVVCEGVPDAVTGLRVAERIRGAVDGPTPLGGGEVYVTVSVGVAVADASAQATEVIRDADAAMYQAKERGRARCELFDPTMRRRRLEGLGEAGDLRRALERDELLVHYQPVVSLRTGEMLGVEALVRWEHPERGVVPPSDFVPLAEDTGLIVPLGEWVLARAAEQVEEWQRRGLVDGAFTVNVNLSARQLLHPDLPTTVAATLGRTGLSPGALCLEITESVLMDDAELTLELLTELKSLGVHLAIDDFGTGYSSLAYLKRFPVDVLKIDKSFVFRLGEEVEDTAIVAAVVNLARSLGVAVAAEGVETERQRAELRALGCDTGQGFLFARPLPAAQLEVLLRDRVR